MKTLAELKGRTLRKTTLVNHNSFVKLKGRLQQRTLETEW